ncbi:MAG: hypothetical protein QXT00_02540 [Ignisphaera sp.]
MAIFNSERINTQEYKASAEQWKEELRKHFTSALTNTQQQNLLQLLFRLKVMLEINERLSARQYNVDDAIRR